MLGIVDTYQLLWKYSISVHGQPLLPTEALEAEAQREERLVEVGPVNTEYMGPQEQPCFGL